MRYRSTELGKIALGCTGLVSAASLAAALLAAPAGAQQRGPLTQVTGPSPFADCTADDVEGQSGTNYPNTEIEPYLAGNPADPSNLITGYHQDRWSNGAARSDVSDYTTDGGRTWRQVIVPGITKCTGGTYDRASDPWLSFSPNGTAYFMSLVTNNDLPNGSFGANGMAVNRSTDGGRTWGRPIFLRRDPAGQALNDKNSLTADPNSSRFAYAVWDRLVDFELPPNPDAPVAGGGDRSAAQRPGLDGVVIARRNLKRLQTAARTRQVLPLFFKGPTRFTRTTNGGRSWEPTKVIYDPGRNAQTINNIIEVLPSGTVIDLFTEIRESGVARIGLLRSFNRGASFESRPRYVTTIQPGRFGGVFTPDEQFQVRDANILFDTAVDPRNGRLYVVWQDTRFRGVDEVAFSQSSDGGLTWSTPIRINKTPTSSNDLRNQAFIPAIEVAAGGQLVVTYYDFRRDRTSGGELADYWAVFCDPSRSNCRQSSSWGLELRLTQESFDYRNAPEANGLFLGDYMGLARTDNAVHAMFGIAPRPEVTNLYTRRITFSAGTAAASGGPSSSLVLEDGRAPASEPSR